MPKVDEATIWFKSPAVDWTLRGRAFASQFEGRVEAVRGVYAHIDTNSSRFPIYDKNGQGKVIVFGSTTALKFGKFLGGVPGRMLQNYGHFHRIHTSRRSGSAGVAFRRVRASPPNPSGVVPSTRTGVHVRNGK
jgi:hypothetical protein